MFTLQQFCEVFHVTRFTVYNWLKAGKIHPVRVGRRWLFSQEEMDRIKKEGL